MNKAVIALLSSLCLIAPCAAQNGIIHGSDCPIPVVANTGVDQSAALNSCAAVAAGMQVVLAAGVINAARVTWPSNTVVSGAGGPSNNCATTIRRPNNTYGNVFTMGAASSSVKRLCINGNYFNNRQAVSFVGSVAGTVLTVSSVTSGGDTLAENQIVSDAGGAGGLLAGTNILSQISGTPGGAGTYQVESCNGVVPSDCVSQTVTSRAMFAATAYSVELQMDGGAVSDATPSFIDDVGVFDGNFMSIYVAGNTKISNCVLTGIGSATVGALYGVWALLPDSAPTVSNCTISRYRTPGILANNATITNSYFYKNSLQTTPTGGGQIGVGGTSIISNNVVEGIGAGPASSGIEINDRTIVTGNVIRNQQALGIAMQFSASLPPNGNALISNNLIESNGIGFANAITPLNGTVLSGNKFFGNSTAILMNGAADYNVVSGNVCFANGTGINNTATGTHNAVANNPGC